MEREELEAVVIGWTDTLLEIERNIKTATNHLSDLKKEVAKLRKTIKEEKDASSG